MADKATAPQSRRVGGDVATPTPHRSGRAGLPLPVLHGRASLTDVVADTIPDSPVKKVEKVKRHPRFRLASLAIRCRFVDRFSRLNVLALFPVNGSLRMAPLFPRSGPGESSSPMSQVVLRCYDFPSRLSGHLFVSLPGSTLPSSVRVSQLALALPEGRRVPSGPGSLFNRRPELPVCSHVDVNGTSQVSRRSILCLCLVPGPRPNQRSLAYLSVSSMLPPLRGQRRLQRVSYFGAIARLQHLLLTLQE